MLVFGIAAGVIVLLGLLVLLVVILLGRPRPVSAEAAREAFLGDRQRLEGAFFNAAATSGKPRGLQWKSCDFGDDLVLARDKQTGELLAFVSVTIAFEAIAGSDMEGLPAVSNLRSASAVFIWREGRWVTNGRTVFNLGPAEAIQHFRNQYEPLPQEDATDATNTRGTK